MYIRRLMILVALVGVLTMPNAFSQGIIGPNGTILNPEPLKDAFQIHYFSNLNIGDQFLNVTNAGALGDGPYGPPSTEGYICVNVYVFSPDEHEIACCACPVTPNALNSLSVNNDLISNTTGTVPNSIVVKLLATIPGTTVAKAGTAFSGNFNGTKCNPGLAFNSNNLAPGMTAWATTIHPTPTPNSYGITETPFKEKFLSTGELASITNRCSNIMATGGGFGICRMCRLGGL